MYKYIGFVVCMFLPLEMWGVEDNQTLPLSKGRGVFYLELNTDYYYTEDNYKNFFQVQPLAVMEKAGLAGNSPFFHYMSNDLSLGYSFADWFELEGFLHGIWFAQSGDGVNIHFTPFDLYRGGGAIRSQQSFGEGVFGLIEEFSFSHPFKNIRSSSTRPFVDDGSHHFTPALWMYASIWNVFYPFIYAGLKFRSKGLSDLFQWKLGLQFQTGIVEIGANTYGFLSAIKEPAVEYINTGRDRLLNAGSLKFGSQNPAVIGFFTWLAWRLPYVTFRLSGDMDVNGTQYAKGYAVSLSVLLNLGGEKDLSDIFQKDPEENFEPQTTLSHEDKNLFKTPEGIFNNTLFPEISVVNEGIEF